MKIGILTLPLHTNYGGILQAYALQTVLERLGHQVVVFSYEKDYKLLLRKFPIVYAKRLLKKYLFNRKDIKVFEERYRKKEFSIISQHTQKFINKYIHIYKVHSFYKLRSDDFDAIVVGSDQVWRPIYFMPMFNTCVENAYLDFAKKWKIRRIAYAVSFGTEEWEYTPFQTQGCKNLIKFFDNISVREESAVRLCKEYFDMDVHHVLDPTFLLSKDDYVDLFNISNTPRSSGNLLNYILDEDPEKNDIINRISRERNLIPFSVNSRVENHNAPLEERIQPSVESWIRGFYDAELVVTDSFHACVFSIIFGKPFVVIGNKKRGMARFESLLKMFDLQDCLITQASDYIIKYCDYQILKENRDKSLSFLIQSLS